MLKSPTSLTLTKDDTEFLDAQARARGISRSAVARLIFREWDEMKRAGVHIAHIGELPHPADAEPVTVVYVREG